MKSPDEIREGLRHQYWAGIKAFHLPHLYDRGEIQEYLAEIEIRWNAEFPGENLMPPNISRPTPDAQPPKGVVPQ